ncbi:MAG: hypothetical protein Q9219_001666 [cf. Caloplaca sp. 3 TL-2023]
MFGPFQEYSSPKKSSRKMDLSVFKQPTIPRSSSDSVVLSKRGVVAGVQKYERSNGRSEDQGAHSDDEIAIQIMAQEKLAVAVQASSPSKSPSRNKTRHQLQLPSFQALGIAVPYPSNILTPPEEPGAIDWKNADPDNSEVTSVASEPIHSSIRPTDMPQDPIPNRSILGASNDTPTQGPTTSLLSPSDPSTQEKGSESSGSSTATEIASHAPWLERALTVILPLVSDGSSTTNVVNVLFHPQPCPLSRNVLGAPSALDGIVTALQTTFERVSADRYIDVTHVVAAKTSFSQLPNSPMTTPNRPAAEASMGDYFSMPRTVVFSRGTIAVSHTESRKNLAENPINKAVPQTVVAPSSIAISILERFLPPATRAELDDLFKWDQPSALVDRMTELKPGSGTLLFVYPTRRGAMTFRNDYLGPILDPLLRTMIGVHGISPSLVYDIADFETIDAMHDFERLRVKMSQLLASMNRKGAGNLHQFTISEAGKQSVHLQRDAWAEWFTEQEIPRIRDIMNKYYGRAVNLPQGGDFTAAGLVREIADGVKSRPYEAGEAPREGIEIGVFVIKRVQ